MTVQLKLIETQYLSHEKSRSVHSIKKSLILLFEYLNIEISTAFEVLGY